MESMAAGPSHQPVNPSRLLRKREVIKITSAATACPNQKDTRPGSRRRLFPKTGENKRKTKKNSMIESWLVHVAFGGVGRRKSGPAPSTPATPPHLHWFFCSKVAWTCAGGSIEKRAPAPLIGRRCCRSQSVTRGPATSGTGEHGVPDGGPGPFYTAAPTLSCLRPARGTDQSPLC